MAASPVNGSIQWVSYLSVKTIPLHLHPKTVLLTGVWVFPLLAILSLERDERKKTELK
jgi:hypothetical protein